MRSVILVDDEYWALRGLETVFPWERHAFTIAGAYEDAIDAMSAILAKPPDLVLTDIRMPELSGLEMICQARQHGVHSLFVIVSGYSEFEYARSALKYGAFDYLLKPISYEDAEALLSRVNTALSGSQEKDGTVVTDNAQFNELLQYVREHATEPLRLKDLAAQFYLNSTYCSELFSKKLGCSFSSYVHRLRLERSCTLLHSTALSIEEVARRTGFHDSAHFHKVFKNALGETPAQYRKKRNKL